jgi:hypothetical protein
MHAPESRSSSNRRVGLAISGETGDGQPAFIVFFVSSLHRGCRFFRRVYARYYKFSFSHVDYIVYIVYIVVFTRIATARWRPRLASPLRNHCPTGWWP